MISIFLITVWRIRNSLHSLPGNHARCFPLPRGASFLSHSRSFPSWIEWQPAAVRLRDQSISRFHKLTHRKKAWIINLTGNIQEKSWSKADVYVGSDWWDPLIRCWTHCESSAQIILRRDWQRSIALSLDIPNPNYIRVNLCLVGFEWILKEMDQSAALDLGEKHNWCKQINLRKKCQTDCTFFPWEHFSPRKRDKSLPASISAP